MNTQSLSRSFPLVFLEWIARAGSILSITLLAALFAGEGFHPLRVAPKQWVGLIFFPLGVMLGMVVAWWKEGWGALVAILSLGAFYLIYGYVLGSHISGWWFLVFTLPGFLFLLHALLVRVWPVPEPRYR